MAASQLFVGYLSANAAAANRGRSRPVEQQGLAAAFDVVRYTYAPSVSLALQTLVSATPIVSLLEQLCHDKLQAEISTASPSGAPPP